LNARIGYPNEHLASGHIEELAKPMYSTCIGLILKGYNDFENNRKQFETRYAKVEVPESLTRQAAERETDEVLATAKARQRKTLKGFMDSFKNGIIDLFKEEEDAKF
jgi:cell division protein FtsA